MNILIMSLTIKWFSNIYLIPKLTCLVCKVLNLMFTNQFHLKQGKRKLIGYTAYGQYPQNPKCLIGINLNFILYLTVYLMIKYTQNKVTAFNNYNNIDSLINHLTSFCNTIIRLRKQFFLILVGPNQFHILLQ